jgi:hypothetical protein
MRRFETEFISCTGYVQAVLSPSLLSTHFEPNLEDLIVYQHQQERSIIFEVSLRLTPEQADRFFAHGNLHLRDIVGADCPPLLIATIDCLTHDRVEFNPNKLREAKILRD